MSEPLKTTMQKTALEVTHSFSVDTTDGSVRPSRVRTALPGLFCLLISAALASPAQAGSIYRCESNTGVIEYSNSKPKDRGDKECEALDLPSITTIPAPTLPAKKPAAAKPAASAAKGFPKISNERQQRRDNARKEILRDELDRERDRLGKLREEFKDGEPERLGSERNYQKDLDRVERLRGDISRRESNIGALQRELEDLKN